MKTIKKETDYFEKMIAFDNQILLPGEWKVNEEFIIESLDSKTQNILRKQFKVVWIYFNQYFGVRIYTKVKVVRVL